VHCRSKNIIENQFLLEAGCEAESVQNESKTNDLKCTSCQVDNALATSWCVDCAEYICDGCVQVGFVCTLYFMMKQMWSVYIFIHIGGLSIEILYGI
jgi:hypothetical protein